MISSLSHLTRLARTGYVFAREGVFALIDTRALPLPERTFIAMARLLERPSAKDGSGRLAAALTKLGDAQLADISVPLATRIDNASQSYTKAGHIDGKNAAAKAGLEKIKAVKAKLGAAKKRG